MYDKRKEYLEGMLDAEAKKLINQAKFIRDKIKGNIDVGTCDYNVKGYKAGIIPAVIDWQACVAKAGPYNSPFLGDYPINT